MLKTHSPTTVPVAPARFALFHRGGPLDSVGALLLTEADALEDSTVLQHQPGVLGLPGGTGRGMHPDQPGTTHAASSDGPGGSGDGPTVQALRWQESMYEDRGKAAQASAARPVSIRTSSKFVQIDMSHRNSVDNMPAGQRHGWALESRAH